MKVLVLGATGATGRLVVTGALARGHEVSALARNQEHLTKMAHLNVVQGDVLDPASLDRVVPGHETVFFCVGSGNTGKSTVRTEGMRNTVVAMKKAGVPRLIAMSGLGAGSTRSQMGFLFDKVLAPFVLKDLLEDQNGLEAEIRKSGLDWIVIRPSKMSDDAPKGKWVVSLDGSGVKDGISRADVAAFMLDQLQSSDYLRKAPAIGY